MTLAGSAHWSYILPLDVQTGCGSRSHHFLFLFLYLDKSMLNSPPRPGVFFDIASCGTGPSPGRMDRVFLDSGYYVDVPLESTRLGI